MDKARILFVDDDTAVLNGLRRMLHKLSAIWHMDFAAGGEVALAMMQVAPYDVLVTDMRMPGMDGAQLLQRVQASYPQTIRFVLSGQSDHQNLVQTAGLAHQFLAKPCNADVLKRAIQRAENLRTLLTNPALQRLVSSMQGIPVVPAILAELMASLASPDSSLKEMGSLVARDVGLTTKVLQLVNSPLFGLRQQIHDPQQAVVLLGMEMINALVLAVSTFDAFQGDWPPSLLESLYSHALRVGKCARRLAREMGAPETLEWALVGGMLHDVGKLILLAQAPAAMHQAAELMASRGLLQHQAETEVLGVSHAEVGAYLLGLWGFDAQVVKAVAFHHQAPEAGSRPIDLATIVFIANVLDHACAQADLDRTAPDLSCLEALGPDVQRIEWQSFYQAEKRTQ